MWVVADQRDLLEDTMYRRLFTLWDEFAGAQVVFDDHGSDNHFCAQKVWEALLAAFPLTHARMQTQIFVRELSRLMTWDVRTVDDVNHYFLKVSVFRKVLSYMKRLTIVDGFKAVILATLKVSDNSDLRAATSKSLMTWTMTNPSTSPASKPPALASSGTAIGKSR